MATPRVCLDLFGEEHDDHGFLIHESPLFLLATSQAIMSPATPLTKDYKQCSMHGTTFLPEVIFRAIFKWGSRSPLPPTASTNSTTLVDYLNFTPSSISTSSYPQITVS